MRQNGFMHKNCYKSSLIFKSPDMGDVMKVQDLRWPFGCVGVLLLLALRGTFRRHICFHLSVITDLVVLSQVLELHLLLG